LGRGSLAAFLGKNIIQADVEVRMGDRDLFEVLHKLGGHCWWDDVDLELNLVKWRYQEQ
jgi:hypothetical protein